MGYLCCTAEQWVPPGPQLTGETWIFAVWCLGLGEPWGWLGWALGLGTARGCCRLCPGLGAAPPEPLRSGVCRQAWQGLTPKPHAPFDGVGPTSPNLKRHPGLSVRPGSTEPRWPRTPCAGSSRRGSACRGSGLPFGSRSSHPVCPALLPCAPRSRGCSVPGHPAVTPAGEHGVAVRCERQRKREAVGKPRSCKNAARSFLVLVLLPARMRAGHRLPLSIPSINPAAQLPRAELRLAGQRLRQSPVSKSGSASGRSRAPPVAPGGRTGAAEPRAAVPRGLQGRAGLLPLAEPG